MIGKTVIRATRTRSLEELLVGKLGPRTPSIPLEVLLSLMYEATFN